MYAVKHKKGRTEKVVSSKIKHSLKKQYWLYLLLFMILAIILIQSIPQVLAIADKGQIDQTFKDFINGFNVTAFDRMMEAYSNFDDFLTGENFDFHKELKTVILGIGQSMVVIYALIGIIKESQKGEISMEYWLRIFMATAVAVLVIISIIDILDAIYAVGKYIIEMTQNLLKNGLVTPSFTNDSSKNTLINSLSQMPGLSSLKNIIGSDPQETANFYQIQQAEKMLNILNYVVWFPMVICIFLTYSAIFEIKIRQLFAPIAVAVIASEGVRSAGMRFLKKYLACLIKVAIYFAIAFLGTALTSFFYDRLLASTVTDGLDVNLILMLLANVVAGMAMMQTGGLGDEIVGV